jgi:hypothetical protein
MEASLLSAIHRMFDQDAALSPEQPHMCFGHAACCESPLVKAMVTLRRQRMKKYESVMIRAACLLKK